LNPFPPPYHQLPEAVEKKTKPIKKKQIYSEADLKKKRKERSIFENNEGKLKQTTCYIFGCFTGHHRAWRRRTTTVSTFLEVFLCNSWNFRGLFCNFYMLEYVFKLLVFF
jgi:hypothetical protein